MNVVHTNPSFRLPHHNSARFYIPPHACHVPHSKSSLISSAQYYMVKSTNCGAPHYDIFSNFASLLPSQVQWIHLSEVRDQRQTHFNTALTFQIKQHMENFWLAEELTASQNGLCRMELFKWLYILWTVHRDTHIREQDQQDPHFLLIICFNWIILDMFRTNNCSPFRGCMNLIYI